MTKRIRNKKLYLICLSCAFFSYFFLATFNPFLHNHSYGLLDLSCNSHNMREGSEIDDHKPEKHDSKRCPACEFLIKAHNATMSDTAIFLIDNRNACETAPLFYQNIYHDDHFSLCLQRAPPSNHLS